MLDTSSIARLFPFSPPDLDTRRGTLYGIDMRACAPVVYDPWDGTHLNANTAVLARSGSGKSFATKLGVLRGITRGVTAYVIDPEGEYADMARAAGGRVLSPGIPGQGMNPFVIERGDSEELLQRIGSLRRLIEVMVGERLSADRRASLDHALAGYYAQPRERTGFRDFYAYLEGGGERPLTAAPALRHRQPETPPLRRGRRPARQRGPGDGLRPAAAGAGASARRSDGLHRDGVGRRGPGPQAEAAGGGRGVEHHAAPRRRGLHGQRWRSGRASTAWDSSSSPRTSRTCSPRTPHGPSPATPVGRSYRTPPSSCSCSRTRRPSAPWATLSTCPKTCNAGCSRAPGETGCSWRRDTASPCASRPPRRRRQ